MIRMRHARSKKLHGRHAHPQVELKTSYMPKSILAPFTPRNNSKRRKAQAKWMRRMVRRGLLASKLAAKVDNLL